MADNNLWYLSTIVFAPTVGALLLGMSLLFPRVSDNAVRIFTLLVTVFIFVISIPLVLPTPFADEFDTAAETMQRVCSVPWIPSFHIYYYMGLDGISFPLVVLTAFICMLAMAASWSVKKQVIAYCILFLLLETGMLGVFMALDFFLFYVFWEVMLLPMYFLIGVWGGPRKEYAAIKFFLYTLVGSVLMLIAILMLYFGSDLRTLAKSDFQRVVSDLHLPEDVQSRLGMANLDSRLVFLRKDTTDGDTAQQGLKIEFVRSQESPTDAATVELVTEEEGRVVRVTLARDEVPAATVMSAIHANSEVKEVLDVALGQGSEGGTVGPEDSLTIEPCGTEPVHTFDMLALAAVGQRTTLFDTPVLFGGTVQHWAFLLLLVGFIIKVPSVPFHTWLPDAHVEAPTPISMILAGLLLKMGGYGIIRICYPICPHAGYDLAWLVCAIGVISMVYGAFAAMAQRDFKRLVAYSSVSHMGYVVLGLGVWTATASTVYDPDYWIMGVKGAMFQMIAHGISSAGMFFMVGVIYDRVHHRDLNEFGGLFAKMPIYSGLSIGIFFAALGLPGLCGFIGEVLVVLSVWNYSQIMAVISASVVILTAGYILWAVQRVYLGPEYKGPHGEALTPITPRETAIAVPLFVVAIWFGVYPQSVFRYMDRTVERQVRHLAEWTKDVKEHPSDAQESPASAATASVTREESLRTREVTRTPTVTSTPVAMMKTSVSAMPDQTAATSLGDVKQRTPLRDIPAAN